MPGFKRTGCVEEVVYWTLGAKTIWYTCLVEAAAMHTTRITTWEERGGNSLFLHSFYHAVTPNLLPVPSFDQTLPETNTHRTG